MFQWDKKGHIYAPSEKSEWIREYAQNPNALVLPDRIRIYFAGRRKSETDGMYVSYISFVDVEKDNPSKIIYNHERPVIDLGEGGAFDEFGTMPGSFLQMDNGDIRMYYVGWTRTKSVPYRWANGLAVSIDGGFTFNRADKAAIISSNYTEPYLQACPRVFRLGENNWRMWYASGIEWYEHDGRLNPIYVIMPGKSKDGIHWELEKEQAIPSVSAKECQSSASLIEYNGLYHMFFSSRHVVESQNSNKEYRIGYAWSKDLINWNRDDSKAGIDVSSEGWDSDAVCYPHVVSVGEKIYMFYSGNYYGRAGFGYAELRQ